MAGVQILALLAMLAVAVWPSTLRRGLTGMTLANAGVDVHMSSANLCIVSCGLNGIAWITAWMSSW